MSDSTSADMAGGIAVGFNGHIHGFNADVEIRLDRMMIEIGKWVESESGVFLGHVKMAIMVNDRGVTLNLTDLNEGVLHHSSLAPSPKADFNFMAAVLDVDKEELEHRIIHAMEDSGVDFCFDEAHECGCGHDHHHDGHSCGCHKH